MNTPPIVDHDLVARAQTGDADAAHEILKKLEQPLTGFIRRMLGPRWETNIEDIRQDVLLKMLRALHRFEFDRGVKFSTWVFTFARNHCIDLLKKKRLPIQDLSRYGDELAISDPRGLTPLRATQSVEIRERVDLALREIPEIQRDAFELHQIGMEHTQIAGRLGIQPGTVKSRLHRARVALRHQLRDLAPDGGRTPKIA